jgi:putative membrane protein
MAGVNPFKRPAWLDEGEDPDYRYSLANERTFLAWIRTALALLAGAIAVVQLVPEFRVPGVRTVLGAILAASGVLASGLAYVRWAANERSMRTGRPLPYSAVLVLLAVALTAVGVAAFVFAIVEAR